MFSGHPILDEIKKGFKLRPTKTVDKSKPIIYAEGEDESEVAVTKRAPPTGIAPPGKTVETPKPSSWIPPPVQNGSIPPPPVMLGANGIPPPPPMMGGGIPPPPPMMGGIPPPPPMGLAAPPPPPPVQRPKTPLNPALAKLGGKTPGNVDQGEFLKSIQGGFKLKKAVTNDKSGLFVDEEMREKSVTLVERAPSSYIPPPRARSPISRPHSSLGFGSEDDRFRTSARTPEPRDDSPEQLLGQRRPIVMRRKGDPPPPPPEFGFDSDKQKITSEDIEKEIKKGSVASKMAALMGNMGFAQDKIDQVGTGSLPRATFRKSPMRSSILPSPSEVNNNGEDDDVPRPKPVSKWHVDTNYGLRTASRSNVPFEKEKEKQERATSVLKERSSSWLDLSKPGPIERARTQSPIPLCERLELDEMDFDELCDLAEAERKAAGPKKKVVKKKSKVLPNPITVNTDFCTTGNPTTRRPSNTPQIQETPPTPAQKKTYGYANKSTRCSSPSSMSSTSAPSPSSLSAGSVSPEQTPKRRGSNPNFEKAKQKWGAEERRESITPTKETSPVKEKSPEPVVTNTKPTKKVSTTTTKKSSTSTPPPPCFAVVPGAEAKGATAVANAKTPPTRRTSNTPLSSTSNTILPVSTKAAGETIRDRANRFREQLQADDDKGKKAWQHPFMSAPSSSPLLFSSSSSPVASRLSAREQLFSSTSTSSTQTSRIINVPISAPWYNGQQFETQHNERNNSASNGGYQTSPYRISYEDCNPSQMRDLIRFNIDLSHDLPLSISRR